jgi:Xaa-Pro aminopeptidase
MYRYFDSGFFTANRERLRQLFTGTAPIVITANGLLQRNSDSTFSFRQDSNFWYLTGVNHPDVVLVIDKFNEYLILPSHEHSKEVFDGQLNAEEISATSGIAVVMSGEEGWKKLASRIKKVKHLATLPAPAAYVQHYGMYTNPARSHLMERIKEFNSEVEFLDLSQHLIRMRSIKQPPELKAIQEAINVTIKAIKSVRRKTYQHEYEIEAAITSEFRKAGTQGHGFTPIVSAGKRACVLHQSENNGAIADGDLIVVDIGAEVENYSADISRTYTQGKPTKRQRAIHEAVVDVQQYAFSLLAPGVLLKEYEQKVEHYMGEKLRELGLISTIEHDAVREYYPHATSHFLGLDVHDVGDYSRPLELGMVLTVEPGIYIPGEGVGVRIEDNVLVTETGVKILTDSLPRELT